MAEKVVIRNCRFDWVRTFEPERFDETSDPKFSICVLIPKDHPQVKAIQDAALRVAKAAYPDVKPKDFKLPLRDGDEDREDIPAYAGHMFMNAGATVKYPPQNITGVVKERKGDKVVFMEADSKDWGSGDYGTISVELYPFKVKGNVGTAAGINMVQFTKKGEPLGRRDHSGDFEAAPVEEAGDNNY